MNFSKNSSTGNTNSNIAGASSTNTTDTTNTNTNTTDASNTNTTGTSITNTEGTGRTNTAVNSKHKCPYCSISLTRRYVLGRHISRLHPGKPVPTSTFKGSCACILCDTKLCSTKALILHYNSRHKKDFKLQKKSFDSGEEFDRWKRNIEREHMLQFVKQRGSTKNKTKCMDSYYCNRSANGSSPRLKPPDERKRAEKLQGTSKLSSKCTCYMRVTHIQKNGKVVVEYCLEHIGHEIELFHLNLSSDLRSSIAAKLASGVETGKILSDIRNNIHSINRDTLLTRKDIQNIKQQYNISRFQRNPDDTKSVCLWVEEMREEADNPIIYFKAKGESVTHNSLKENDFLLCIQTPFQKEMMIQHSNKMICADSTRSTTNYDFLLTSVVVIDDFGKGIPVAWAVSNREDAEVLTVFMSALREANNDQDYSTEVFMSDLANTFYTAWCNVFTAPEKRLYCTWHVDREWKKKLKEFLAGRRKLHHEIYAYLCMLRQEVDEAKFRKMLTEFSQYLETECPLFDSYFHNTYVKDNKIELWAACFRQGSAANTNKYAEAFHRVIKDIYLNIKQNKRVDQLLFALFSISRDKACEQLIKFEKGKITHRLREIRSRHESAMSVSGICFNEQKNEWVVPALSDTASVYYVQKAVDYSECQCNLRCPDCKVCIHMFACTCTDFLSRSLPCKHIHAIQNILLATSLKGPEISTPLPDNEVNGCVDETDMTEPLEVDAGPSTRSVHTDSREYFKPFICTARVESSNDLQQLRTKALSDAHSLIEFISYANSCEALKSVIDNLATTMAVAHKREPRRQLKYCVKKHKKN